MEKKPRQFTFPTAFTILFIPLVLIALATWVIPAGSYELDADGAPIPGTYQQVPSNPQKLLVSALMGQERVRELYRHAVDSGYRFFSYGDASLLIPKGS